MPEHAEVRHLVEYINKNTRGFSYNLPKKNLSNKNKLNVDSINLKNGFEIRARQRGKEIQLQLGSDYIPMTFTLAMTGTFIVVDGKINVANQRHYHLWFKGKRDSGKEHYLVFQDYRKFGKWRFEGFNYDRSPDPRFFHDKFKENILFSLENPIFKKPIYEALLDQKFFNGIGNYLRSTILYHFNKNPFGLSAKEFILLHKHSFFDAIKDALDTAYELGGAELMTWTNPNISEAQRANIHEKFMDWCYYKKGKKLVDSQGRTFWFDPIWAK